MRRVAIAPAPIADPKILVADEPIGGVNTKTGEAVTVLFKRLAHEEGLAILRTTRNPVFGYEADRIIRLSDGQIVKQETGSTKLRLEPVS